MAGAASQAGDADSFWAPGLTSSITQRLRSDLRRSVGVPTTIQLVLNRWKKNNVHHGTRLKCSNNLNEYFMYLFGY